VTFIVSPAAAQPQIYSHMFLSRS